jgi:hypothetical protein
MPNKISSTVNCDRHNEQDGGGKSRGVGADAHHFASGLGSAGERTTMKWRIDTSWAST